LNLNAVTTSMQSLTIGLIILIAVGLDVWRARIGAILSGLFTPKAARS
jgi:ribose transport system permease protein